MEETRPFVSWDLVHDFMVDVFVKYGVPEEDARICTDVLLESDRRGIESHGCNRFKPIYLDRIKNGTLLPKTEIEIVKDTPCTVVMDAHNGMGMVASHKMMEMLIEKTKETYYESLQASSNGWHEGENSYEPFVKYYLGIMLKAYNEFESRVEHLKHRSISKPDRIKAVIDNKVGKITKKEIMELCPDISKITVERTLTNLVKSGYIAKVGAGPSTGYVRI